MLTNLLPIILLIMPYAMIFLLKIVEVSIATVRIIMITKGEKTIGSIIAFFEISLWLFLVTNVLQNIQDDPWKALMYILGFSVGQFVGSTIENKLSIGTVRVEAIVLREHEKELVKYLREKQYAVTVLEAQGMNFPRSLLLFFVDRKKLKGLISEIKISQPNVVLAVDDIKPIYGGYRMMRKK